MISLFLLPLIAGAEKVTEKTAERLTVDGRQFTINQKDFKPAKFSLYGREFDDTYGFVSPDYLPLDNRGYAEVYNI